MKASSRHFVLCQTAIALAVLAACGAARAESTAQGSVSVGAGAVSGDSADRALFGQYNGMRNDTGYGLLDFDYYRFDPDTGRVVDVRGSNLGLDTRALQFGWKKQGDWKFSLDYGELTRRDPNTINTGLANAGSATPQTSYLAGGVGSGADLGLKTKRTRLGLTMSKWFGSKVEVEVSLKGEKKEGERLFGIGMNCGSVVAPGCPGGDALTAGAGILLLPEPIDSNHGQIEARVNYAGAKLHVSGGYYGSFFNNQFTTLNPNVSGPLNNALGDPLTPSASLLAILSQPVALAPDNQAHQVDLTGNYAFTPTTRANFKFAYGQATQKQDFVGFTGVPVGVTNLGGRVDTSLALLGLTSRPLPKLSLQAEARWEDRDDQTPLALYNVVGAGGYAYTNLRLPNTKTRGKVAATYQFTSEIQGTVGANYEHIDRGTFTASSAVAGITALRQNTDETGVYVELRKRLTETFSGALKLETSNRDGSNWLQPSSTGFGVTEVTTPSVTFTPDTAILMPTLADRRRDKARLYATWQPMDELSLQFSAEGGEDKYKGSDTGLRSTRMSLYSIDFDYLLSDEYSVRLNGYASLGSQRLNQARPGGYILAFDNTNTTVGLNVVGKPLDELDIGGGVVLINDRNEYAQRLDAATAYPGNVALLNAAGGLPDIVYRSTQFKLFGKYALSEASAVRVDAMYQWLKWNDWAYSYNGVYYTYGDNTTVSMKPTQEVGYLGVTYIYTWR